MSSIIKEEKLETPKYTPVSLYSCYPIQIKKAKTEEKVLSYLNGILPVNANNKGLTLLTCSSLSRRLDPLPAVTISGNLSSWPLCPWLPTHSNEISSPVYVHSFTSIVWNGGESCVPRMLPNVASLMTLKHVPVSTSISISRISSITVVWRDSLASSFISSMALYQKILLAVDHSNEANPHQNAGYSHSALRAHVCCAAA